MYENTATQVTEVTEFEAMMREMEEDIAQFGNPWPEFNPTEADFEAMMRDDEAYRARRGVPAA